jgi:hypothetical protein
LLGSARVVSASCTVTAPLAELGVRNLPAMKIDRVGEITRL